MVSLYSNRQASSRDIAERFARMEQLSFICNQGVVPTDQTVRYCMHKVHQAIRVLQDENIIFIAFSFNRCGDGLANGWSCQKCKNIQPVQTQKLRIKKRAFTSKEH